MEIRDISPEDAEELASLDLLCFNLPWSRKSFFEEAQKENTIYLAAVEQGTIVGYAGTYIVAGEAQVTNIAVAPDARGRGIGTKLLAALITRAKERGANAMTLEVRPSNKAALRLYKKFRLKAVGERPHYYADNGEAALILWNTDLAATIRELPKLFEESRGC